MERSKLSKLSKLPSKAAKQQLSPHQVILLSQNFSTYQHFFTGSNIESMGEPFVSFVVSIQKEHVASVGRLHSSPTQRQPSASGVCRQCVHPAGNVEANETATLVRKHFGVIFLLKHSEIRNPPMLVAIPNRFLLAWKICIDGLLFRETTLRIRCVTLDTQNDGVGSHKARSNISKEKATQVIQRFRTSFEPGLSDPQQAICQVSPCCQQGWCNLNWLSYTVAINNHLGVLISNPSLFIQVQYLLYLIVEKVHNYSNYSIQVWVSGISMNFIF